MLGAGVLTLVWALLVWQWQDPFTALYTHWQQHQLAQSLDRELAAYRPRQCRRGRGERRAIALDAQRFRREAQPGQAIGRIEISRIGLHMVLVDGTDHDSLKKGPGRDARSAHARPEPPRLHRGHRTTYLAPFSHIDAIRAGDAITLEMPYATFTYRVTASRRVRRATCRC